MWVNISIILFSIILAVSGQVSMKYGAIQIGPVNTSNLLTFFQSAFTNIYTLLGLFLYFVSALFWIIALSRVELSYAYPMVSLGYILVLFLSSVLFKEVILPIHWIGIILIISGVVLITRGR